MLGPDESLIRHEHRAGGRGHTDHDLLVGAGDVLFPGDLVEEGADPSFEDLFPADWIRTLTKIAALDNLYSTFVPGHGAPVDAEFVRTQLEKVLAAITRSALQCEQDGWTGALSQAAVMSLQPRAAKAAS